jgi:folylpolyglutamate synthase/dihydropteroate synthase
MFIKNLIRYYPYQKFVFLIAFKRGKDYKDILRYVVPFANKIIVTSFFNQTKSQGMVTIAEDMNVIAQTLKDLSFNNFVLCEDNKKAVLKLLSSKSMVKIVTGSLYLLSDVYPILNDLIISQPTQRQTCITGSSR